tara:strand:- start:1016 stop:1687 length:672 start_codon:yes stop_codon:yes gene_type:complete
MHLKKSRKVLIYFFLLILLGSINNLSLNKINFNEIKNIKITGLDTVDSKNLKNNIQNLKFENFFLLSSKKIVQIINSNNLVENYKIFKIYPSTLDIQIKKTVLLAKINQKGVLYIVGSNGKLLNSNLSNNELPYIFGKPDITEFLKFKKIIDNSKISYKEIKSFYYFQSKRWDIKLKNNIEIKLSNKNMIESLENVHRFLNDKSFENLKIIDARINNQIIING